MRKVFSERNIVVFLFVVALIVFSLAQEDARKVEKMYFNGGSAQTSIIPTPQKSASTATPVSSTLYLGQK